MSKQEEAGAARWARTLDPMGQGGGRVGPSSQEVHQRGVGAWGFKAGTLLLVPFICCLALKTCHGVCNGNTSVIARIIWIIDLRQWNC